MKLSRILFAVAVSAGLVSAPASGAVITVGFDDVTAPALFVDQTVQLTNEYAALGLLFSSPTVNNKNEILNNSSFSVPAGVTNPNLLASADTLQIEGSFTVPVFSVGAIIGISGGTDRLSIFDASDTLLGTVVGDDSFVSLSSATPIARFTVTAETGTTPAIDNLTFGVPEPGTLALLGLGLAGLAASRRRKQ